MATETHSVGRAQHSDPNFTPGSSSTTPTEGHPMKVGSRLALSLFAWFLAMPAIFVAAGALDQRKFRLLTENVAPIIIAVLFAGAVWIYWRLVPRAPGIGRRILHLTAFLAVLFVLGAAAMWVSFWVMMAIHGA